MTVIIPHSTEELMLIKLQKELIDLLFEAGRIITAAYPLWIELGDFELSEKSDIKKVELGELETEGSEIFCPVTIKFGREKLSSKLTLVSIYSNKDFSDKDKIKLSQKKQPVKQLTVFRLGITADQGPHAKSISKSVWCKIK